MMQPQAILFDLDGTLLDTAPDMIAALLALRLENGLNADCELSFLRQFVSKGAVGLLQAGMPECDDQQRERWRLRFLELYSQDLSGRTVLFDGMEEVMGRAEARGVGLGIVTNKPGYLTDALLQQLELTHRFGVVVSGDTLAERKPDPAPVRHACQQLRADPSQVLFVGDDQRDIEAGRSAGTPTVAASYGYILPDHDVGAWQADYVIDAADELLAWLPPQ